jgi:hypothetical protein
MRSLNWNSITASADGDFQQLPAGGYVVRIVDMVDNEKKKYVELVWDIAEGEFANRYSDKWGQEHPYAHHLFLSYKDTALGAAASDKSNAYVSDKTIQIDHDVTLNSLFLLNQNKNKWLGEGRTLTLTSGGLVLRNSSSAIGLPGRTDNGSLVLGDSTHPGYVFAKSSNDSQPNQIWADVTAPGGFVAAYTGDVEESPYGD